MFSKLAVRISYWEEARLVIKWMFKVRVLCVLSSPTILHHINIRHRIGATPQEKKKKMHQTICA